MTATTSTLAINGGEPVRACPMPPRRLFGEEEKAAAVRLFDLAIESGNAFGYNGEEEQAFEKEFAAWMGGGFADGVNSGTNAVFVALGALQLEPGSEIIVPPITDPGGAMPVAMLNCIPVFADSAPGSYNMGARELEAVITGKTRAVVVAHIAGIPADIEGILEVARKHNLLVVEDCAQAHAARIRGRLVGTFGDVAAFSTMSGKHMATAAQGGVVYTRDEELFWRIRRFADRGKPFNLENTANVVPSLNMNLNELSAAVGRVMLRKLPGIVDRRRRIAAQIIAAMNRIDAVQAYATAENSEPSYWFLPVRVNPKAVKVSKDEFAKALSAEGIPVNADYRHMPAEQPWFRESLNCPTPYLYKGKVKTDPILSNAIQATDTHFNIQIHEGFDEQAVADVVAGLKKVGAAYAR